MVFIENFPTRNSLKNNDRIIIDYTDGALTNQTPAGISATNFFNYVTPQMYGAVGDGTTDDTTALKNMFASTAKFIFIPSGTYKIVDNLLDGTPVLTSSVNDRTILAAGVITASSEVKVAFKNTGDRANIQMNINGNEYIAQGVYVSARYVTTKNCIIRNLKSTNGIVAGIWYDLDGLDTAGIVVNNIVTDCNSVGDGILGNANGLSRGIVMTSNQNMTYTSIVANNVVERIIGEEGDCIVVASSNGSGTYYDFPVLIQNNPVTTWTRRAIKIQSNNSTVQGNSFVNTYTNSGDVPNIQNAVSFIQGTNIICEGNLFKNCKFAGQVTINADGSEVVNNVTIRNNTFEGIGTETTSSLIFCDMNGANLQIANNNLNCPNFVNNCINISRVDKGSIYGNVVNVNVGGGAIPFSETSCTNIVDVGNYWSGRYESNTFTVDYGNKRVGINTSNYGLTPTSNLDIVVNANTDRNVKYINTDTVLSDGELVHAIDFVQNDVSAPNTTHAGVRLYTAGTTGLLEMRFYTRDNQHRITFDVNGNLLSAITDTQDLGSSSLYWKRLYLGAGGVLVNGTKVLGSQQPAIADLGGGATLGDVITAFNTLLAAQRTHGIIAT